MPANIPIFIINLKRDTKRRAHVVSELKDKDLQHEIIEAVDGRGLRRDQITKFTDLLKSKEEINRSLTPSEVGCALSHRKVYQTMLDRDLPNAIVLEDDIDIAGEWTIDNDLLGHMPEDWEILLIGHYYESCTYSPVPHYFWHRKTIHSTTIRKPALPCFGTHGYVINRQGAKRMLDLTEKLSMPIDHYTGDARLMNLYILQEPLVVLNATLNMSSNIENERVHEDEIRNIKTQKTYRNKIKNILQASHLLKPIQLIKNKTRIFLGRIIPPRKYLSHTINRYQD